MLFKRRKQQEELARREAEGESFWTHEFSGRTRLRLARAFTGKLDQSDFSCVVRRAHELVCDDEGADRLRDELNPANDLQAYMNDCDAEEFASVIEAMLEGLMERIQLKQSHMYTKDWRDLQNVVAGIRGVLQADRVAWELADTGQMEPFSSRELYVEVVQPALSLLASRDGWEKVEKAYRDALGEIYDDPGDAITDAGTALQEAMVAAGLQGNNLGRLIADAQKKGILEGHNLGLAGSIVKAFSWASANRSEKGESHSVSDATSDDAWLMIHITGALIVWLSQQSQP